MKKNIIFPFIFIVGVSTTFAQSVEIAPNQTVNKGFTQEGENAPITKKKKIVSTTHPLQSNQVVIPMGIDPSKIVSINVLVAWDGGYIPPRYNANAGFEYNYFTQGSDIIIVNSASSNNIVNRQIKIIIEYEQ